MLETFISQINNNNGSFGPLIIAWCQFLGVTVADWNKVNFVADSQLPNPGDIIVFDTGDTSIFVHDIDWNSWKGLDVIFSGKTVDINQHDWSHVIYWYTPKDPSVMKKTPVATSSPALASRIIAPPRTAPSKSDVIHVLLTIPKYGTMTDACSRTNSIGSLRDGEYYIYKRLNGVMNVTSRLGESIGIWINPEDLKPKPDWRTTYEPFRDKYGEITSKYFVAIERQPVIDLEHGNQLEILANQPILIGGLFTGPDDERYARPYDAATRFSWFGVRTDNLILETEVTLESTPELDVMPAVAPPFGMRAKIVSVLQNPRRVFDIIKTKI